MALCGVIVLWSISNRETSSSIPYPERTEICSMLVTKDIVKKNSAVNEHCFVSTSFNNSIILCIRQKSRYISTKIETLTRINQATSSQAICGDGKVEIIRNRKCQNFKSRVEPNIMSGSVASIDHIQLYFCKIGSLIILRDEARINECNVGPHLRFAELSLGLHQNSSVGDAVGHADRDTFHGGRGSPRFGNRGTHVRFLAIGDLSGQINGLPESLSLLPKDPKLQQPDKDQSAVKPPIGRRFVLAAICVVARIVLVLRGAMIGILAASIACGIWFMTNPITWAWPVRGSDTAWADSLNN